MTNEVISLVERPISPLSGRPADYIFDHIVLGKYEARYAYDRDIGYIFAVAPSWLSEAYSNSIAITDTGLLARNIRNVGVVTRSLAGSPQPFSRGVDLGGGYGLFVRGMRDEGFEFFWSDKFTENLVARGFEATADLYSTAVAFEVLEHLENPLSFLKANLSRYGFETCFFSANCFNESAIPDKDWWYWAFETGQHVSFFSERALRWMAAEIGMQLSHIEDDVYAFSRFSWKPNGNSIADRIIRELKAKLDALMPRSNRHSLTFDDHCLLRSQLRDKTSK